MFALRGALVLVSTTALCRRGRDHRFGNPRSDGGELSIVGSRVDDRHTVKRLEHGARRQCVRRPGAQPSRRGDGVESRCTDCVVGRRRSRPWQRTCGSTPVMSLFVDGTSISTVQVTAASWTITRRRSSFQRVLTIGVGFANHGRSSFCSRSLFVDRVTVVASATQTTTTTTSATTTTPSPTTTTNPPTPTSSTPIPTSPTSVPAARLFNGDYFTWQLRTVADRADQVLQLEWCELSTGLSRNDRVRPTEGQRRALRGSIRGCAEFRWR